MSRTLGQQLVIENLAGAGGTVGSTRVMRATPDGYAIEMGQMGTRVGPGAAAATGLRRHLSGAGADPPGVAYVYAPDRKAERPRIHLAGFNGILPVDGYGGYRALAERGDVSLAFCWAHVRRRFSAPA
jgi:hypothetical protein